MKLSLEQRGWKKDYPNGAMKKVMLSLLHGRPMPKHSYQRLKGLEHRGIVREGELTEEGRIYAVSCEPLDVQCRLLDLPLVNLRVGIDARPEAAVLRHLARGGREGIYGEGLASHHLIYSMVRHCEWCQKEWYPHIAIFRQEKEPQAHIVPVLEGSTEEQYLINLAEPMPYWLWLNDSTEWTEGFWLALYRAIKREELVNLYMAMSSAPQQRYRNGWPDLVIIDNGQVQFIEVKTTDRLIMSQIRTIPMARDRLPSAAFEVLRVM